MLMVGGELYQFLSHFNSFLKLNTLYVEKIDRKSMRGEGKLKQLFSIPLEGTNNKPNFYFVFSPVNGNLLIQFDRANKVMRKQTIGTYVYTEELEELWHNITDVPALGHEFIVGNPHLDAYGNVHMVSTKILVGRAGQDARNRGETRESLELMSIREQGKKVSTYHFNAGKRHLKDIKVLAQDERYVRCVGLYSVDKDWGTQGYYYAEVDAENGELLTEKWSLFSARFLTDTKSSEYQERVLELHKEDSTLPMGDRYRVSHLFENDDKNLIVIAHKAKESSNSGVVGGIPRSGMAGLATGKPAMWGGVGMKLQDDNVLVLNIGGQGNTEWVERIDRNQTTFEYREQGKVVKDYYTKMVSANRSFLVAVLDQKIYFLHNNVIAADSLGMATSDSLSTVTPDSLAVIPVDSLAQATVDSIAKAQKNFTEMSFAELKPDRSIEKHQMGLQVHSWFKILPQFSAATTENQIILFRMLRNGWHFGRIQFANDEETTITE